MKTLELSLQKRLLIVEVGEIEEIIDVQPDFNTALLQGKKFIAVKGNHKLICKGDELSEEIAKGLVDFHSHGTAFKNYKGLWVDRCSTALESFISAIEANKGYYWSENPFEKPNFMDGSYDNNGFGDIDKRQYKKDFKEWQEAESKTFNPEKTLIFEILL